MGYYYVVVINRKVYKVQNIINITMNKLTKRLGTGILGLATAFTGVQGAYAGQKEFDAYLARQEKTYDQLGKSGKTVACAKFEGKGINSLDITLDLFNPNVYHLRKDPKTGKSTFQVKIVPGKEKAEAERIKSIKSRKTLDPSNFLENIAIGTILGTVKNFTDAAYRANSGLNKPKSVNKKPIQSNYRKRFRRFRR